MIDPVTNALTPEAKFFIIRTLHGDLGSGRRDRTSGNYKRTP